MGLRVIYSREEARLRKASEANIARLGELLRQNGDEESGVSITRSGVRAIGKMVGEAEALRVRIIDRLPVKYGRRLDRLASVTDRMERAISDFTPSTSVKRPVPVAAKVRTDGFKAVAPQVRPAVGNGNEHHVSTKRKALGLSRAAPVITQEAELVGQANRMALVSTIDTDALLALSAANRSIKGNELKRAFKRAGLVHTRSKGSHAIFTNPDNGKTVSFQSVQREHAPEHIKNLVNSLLSAI